MSVAVVDSNTVIRFIEAKEAFKNCVEKYFKLFDSDGGGAICSDKFRKGLGWLFTVELKPATKEGVDGFYAMIFDKFDEDHDGKLNLKEFTSLVEEIMRAMARGMGTLPVIVAVDQESCLRMAVRHEIGS